MNVGVVHAAMHARRKGFTLPHAYLERMAWRSLELECTGLTGGVSVIPTTYEHSTDNNSTFQNTSTPTPAAMVHSFYKLVRRLSTVSENI